MNDDALQRAAALIQVNRPDFAEPHLRKHLAAYPDDSVAHAQLANCLLSRGRHVEALIESQLAVELDPGNDHNQIVHAMVLLQNERKDQALYHAEQAIELDPEVALHFGILAMIHGKRRDYPAMLDAADKGLALDSLDMTCNGFRAAALSHLGQSHKSREAIAATLQQAPDDAVVHGHAGVIHLRQGNFLKAQEHILAALRIDPQLQFVRAPLILCRAALHPILGPVLRPALRLAFLQKSVKLMVMVPLFAAWYASFEFAPPTTSHGVGWRMLQTALTIIFAYPATAMILMRLVIWRAAKRHQGIST